MEQKYQTEQWVRHALDHDQTTFLYLNQFRIKRHSCLGAPGNATFKLMNCYLTSYPEGQNSDSFLAHTSMPYKWEFCSADSLLAALVSP